MLELVVQPVTISEEVNIRVLTSAIISELKTLVQNNRKILLAINKTQYSNMKCWEWSFIIMKNTHKYFSCCVGFGCDRVNCSHSSRQRTMFLFCVKTVRVTQAGATCCWPVFTQIQGLPSSWHHLTTKRAGAGKTLAREHPAQMTPAKQDFHTLKHCARLKD